MRTGFRKNILQGFGYKLVRRFAPPPTHPNTHHPYRKFAVLVDWILVLNAGIIALQSQHELVGDKESGNETSAEIWGWECYETVFTFLYFFEMILRVLSSGWKGYWELNRNKFDFVVTVITVGVR